MKVQLFLLLCARKVKMNGNLVQFLKSAHDMYWYLGKLLLKYCTFSYI